jgi:DNA modification methylase
VEIPKGDIHGVCFKDSSDMSEFKDDSIPLIVTSPNYGVGMEYEGDLSFDVHKDYLNKCLSEWGKKVMPGGYLCLNFGDIHNYGTRNGTEPEIQLVGQVYQDCLRQRDIRLRGIIIWDKGQTFVNNRQSSYNEDTNHTSYRHLNNHEYIYIFKKDGKREIPLNLDLKDKISEKEWKDWVGGIWRIAPVKKQVDHPAEFPEEIPRRLIKMYSFKGDIVVDPALGSGTTVKVANKLGRIGFGYERVLKYKPVIMKKLGVKAEDLNQSAGNEFPIEAVTKTTDHLEKMDKVISEIVATDKKRAGRIRSMEVPLKSDLSPEDVIVDWDTDNEESSSAAQDMAIASRTAERG